MKVFFFSEKARTKTNRRLIRIQNTPIPIKWNHYEYWQDLYICWYFILIDLRLTNIDQQNNVDVSMWLIENQTALGFPIWMVGLPCIVLGFVLFKRTGSVTPTPAPTVLKQAPIRLIFTPPEAPVVEGGVLSKGDIDESAFVSDWMQHVRSEIQGMILPDGAQIVENPTQGVQLGLILTRTTPQGSKQALHATAEMLSKIPTPHRFRVEQIDVMATGITLKNMALGGLSKFFAKQDFIITEQIDGLESDSISRMIAGHSEWKSPHSSRRTIITRLGCNVCVVIRITSSATRLQTSQNNRPVPRQIAYTTASCKYAQSLEHRNLQCTDLNSTNLYCTIHPYELVYKILRQPMVQPA